MQQQSVTLTNFDPNEFLLVPAAVSIFDQQSELVLSGEHKYMLKRS